MNPLYLIIGIVILGVTVIDLLWTTLWVDGGAGPLSSRLTSWVWQKLRSIGSQRSRMLSLSGPLILTLTLVMWVGFIWAGWTFIFAGGDPSLIDTRDPGPASWTGRIYFVAYTMFTMGNGDFTPANGVWQIATALTTASGMLFVTLAVSYVLNVLSAVSQKRSFAGSVTGLGDRSETFVRNGWDDGDFRGLDLPINTLSSDLDLLAEQHKSYPILHYYHSEQAKTSSAMAVAIFDEATTILRHGVPEADRPTHALITNARSSADSYLETLSGAFIHPADETPPPPDLDRLHEADVPTVSDAEFDDAVDDLLDRRRKLLGMVTADEWHWPPVDNQ
ncbi:two pore domain potassium channel family protein [Halonotius terrestris]|jgi:hypothetical protein|uniref:Two pore domain potassium channel family protein n=1 Tax=Halonotius terrestris TaxID=2487750 RepID=A0A8J8P9U7_9EURY|nr:potassium channel family protein [Halonotius terrestris]TQQ78739.1 two pore domain potassium channel family protein [Halonotius terrestris]